MILLPILLPAGFAPKVSASDKVAVGDLLAEKHETQENVIKASELLHVPPQKIVNFLKKHLGDKVEKGEVLAQKAGALGVGSKKILSDLSGTILKIDQEKGNVVIGASSTQSQLLTINSPVAGTVDFCNNEKIVIKTDREIILSLDGLGEEAEGEILYFEKLEETELNTTVAGKIILSLSIDKLSLFKAIGLDAAGVVVGVLEGVDFIDLTTKKINTPIMVVSQEDFRKLIKLNKKKIYLNGKDKSIAVL